MNLKKYFRVWLQTSLLSAEKKLATKGASIMYILGKFIRFGIFIFTLTLVFQKNRTVAGYNSQQMINFFLVYNLFDMLGQLFFRGIYWFRHKIVSGEFDFTMVKPLNPLFQELTCHTDFLDLPLLIVVVIALIVRIPITSFSQFLLFLFLFIASCLIITGIHVFVAAVGVLTTEVNHAIWIYRDLGDLARVPIDIYPRLLRSFLTFVIPIGVVFTFPAKMLMGILTWRGVLYSLVIAGLFFWLTIIFWRRALKQYASASS